MKLKALVMTVVGVALGATLLAQDQTRERKLQQAIDLLETKGDAARAMPLLEDVAKSTDQSLAARGLLYLGGAQERQGQARARATYERIVRDFSQQAHVVAQARARLSALTVAAPRDATVTSRLIAKIDRPAYAVGTMSRDGRSHAIVDKEDLWLLDVTTGARQLLIPKDTERDEYPEGLALSRDGKQAAYSTYGKKTGGYRLRIATLAAGAGVKGSRVLLGTDLNWVDPRDFSPDGSSLLAEIQRESRGPIQLVVVSTRDGAFRPVGPARLSGSWSGTGFSPDGRFIAAEVADPSNASNISIFSAAGELHAAVVQHRAHDVFVGWTPDGSAIVFSSDRGGSNGLWMQRLRNGHADGGPELIRPDVGRFVPIGVASSGAIYSSEGFRPAEFEVRSGAIDLAAGRFVESVGSGVRGCVSGATQAPDYSADGRLLAYACIRRSAGRADTSVVIEPVAGGAGRELRPGLTGIGNLRWIPQSGMLLVTGVPADRTPGWWRVDALTGDATPVSRKSPDAPLDLLAGIADDGRKVYFRRTMPGGKERALIAHDLATGGETELFRGPHSAAAGHAQLPEISRDGRAVYFRRSAPGSVRPYVKAEFGVKDVATGTERIVLSGRSLAALNASPDGKYFVTPSNDETTKMRALIMITVADGTVRELMSVPIPAALQREDAPTINPLGLVKWLPDSRSLLVEKQDVDKPTELWWIDVAGQRPPVRLSTDWKGLALRIHPDGRQVVFTTRVAERADPTQIWVLEGVIK